MKSAGATPATGTSSRWPHCSARPVLLVHGFLATSEAVRGLAARMARAGYCTHDVDLGGLLGRFNTRPIEELAHVVGERVERLACDHACERIDLVGHSEGGLIGRYYVQKLGGAGRVRHLVTLGTPHRGTPWAYSGYLFGRVLRSLPQMAPGSAFLRALSDDGFPEGVRLTSIYCERDTVCPPSSCRLDLECGAHLENVAVAQGGHLELLLSAKITSIICRELERVHSTARRRPEAGDERPTPAARAA